MSSKSSVLPNQRAKRSAIAPAPAHSRRPEGSRARRQAPPASAPPSAPKSWAARPATNDPAAAGAGPTPTVRWLRTVIMKLLYGHELSSRYRGIPLHGRYWARQTSPRRASDGGGLVARRMLGYSLLAAQIEDKGGCSRMRDAG